MCACEQTMLHLIFMLAFTQSDTTYIYHLFKHTFIYKYTLTDFTCGEYDENISYMGFNGSERLTPMKQKLFFFIIIMLLYFRSMLLSNVCGFILIFIANFCCCCCSVCSLILVCYFIVDFSIFLRMEPSFFRIELNCI